MSFFLLFSYIRLSFFLQFDDDGLPRSGSSGDVAEKEKDELDDVRSHARAIRNKYFVRENGEGTSPNDGQPNWDGSSAGGSSGTGRSVRFEGLISTCFDDYFDIYVEHEDR